jgi:hypothetical protein
MHRQPSHQKHLTDIYNNILLRRPPPGPSQSWPAAPASTVAPDTNNTDAQKAKPPQTSPGRLQHLLLQQQRYSSMCNHVTNRTCRAAAKALLSQPHVKAGQQLLSARWPQIRQQPQMQINTSQPGRLQHLLLQKQFSMWNHVEPQTVPAVLLRRPHSPPSPCRSWPAAPPAQQTVHQRNNHRCPETEAGVQIIPGHLMQICSSKATQLTL